MRRRSLKTVENFGYPKISRDQVAEIIKFKGGLTERLYLRRVQIRRQGHWHRFYWMVFTLSGSFARYIEAPDRQAAKDFVQRNFPGAKFWR